MGIGASKNTVKIPITVYLVTTITKVEQLNQLSFLQIMYKNIFRSFLPELLMVNGNTTMKMEISKKIYGHLIVLSQYNIKGKRTGEIKVVLDDKHKTKSTKGFWNINGKRKKANKLKTIEIKKLISMYS